MKARLKGSKGKLLGWTHLFEEPGDQGAQDERVVGLPVVVGQADVAGLPQVPLPPV